MAPNGYFNDGVASLHYTVRNYYYYYYYLIPSVVKIPMVKSYKKN